MARGQYYALSTVNEATNGWHIEAIGAAGEPKAAVEERALREICGANWDQPKDLYQDTLMKNLRVVSRTAARRRYHIDDYSEECYAHRTAEDAEMRAAEAMLDEYYARR